MKEKTVEKTDKHPPPHPPLPIAGKARRGLVVYLLETGDLGLPCLDDQDISNCPLICKTGISRYSE